MPWKVTNVGVNNSTLDALKYMLADGYWEPFAASENLVWLRHWDEPERSDG